MFTFHISVIISLESKPQRVKVKVHLSSIPSAATVAYRSCQVKLEEQVGKEMNLRVNWRWELMVEHMPKVCKTLKKSFFFSYCLILFLRQFFYVALVVLELCLLCRLVGLKLRGAPASASQVLKLKVCTTIPRLKKPFSNTLMFGGI